MGSLLSLNRAWRAHVTCSIHHVGLALNLGGIVDVHQNTFQVMQQNTETDGEIESWIYEQARIDDDDIVAMYNHYMGG